jgi:hypothetical protein
MQRRLAILLTVMALAGWTGQILAQDTEDKPDQTKQGLGQNSNENGASKRDHIKITSGPTVELQDTAATVRWNTNRKAATLIRYGTDADNLDQKQGQKGGGTSHSVTLSNLQPGTVYYFAIMTGDDKVKTQGQFQTTGQNVTAENPPEENSSQPDQAGATQPPAAPPSEAPNTSSSPPANALAIVKGPAVEFVTPTAAVIDWSTSARSSSIVHYGTDKNNLDKAEQAPWGSSFHRVAVQNLEPNTTYYFVVESSQAEGTGSGSKSTVAGFQTPASGSQARYNPPVIH